MKQLTLLLSGLLLTLSLGAGTVNAQTPPRIRVVLPERFRALTNQFFDLRVEVENISAQAT